MNSNWITLPCLIVSVAYFGYMRQPTEMGLAIVASAFIGVFVNLDKFAKFKGAGFEAELRETINEVNATMDQLKGIAEPLIAASVRDLNNQHFVVGFDYEEHYEYFDELFSLVEDYEIDIRKTMSEYIKFHRLNIAGCISSIFSIAKKENNLYGYKDVEKEVPFEDVTDIFDISDFNEKQKMHYDRLANIFPKYLEFQKKLEMYLGKIRK